jgi:hypothetical protein
LHKRQEISSPNDFSFSRNIILRGVNYEVQYDDIIIKATNIIFDANPSRGSAADTGSKDGQMQQDAFSNLYKCAK